MKTSCWMERFVSRLQSPASRIAASRQFVDERDMETTTVYTLVLHERETIVRHEVECRSLSMMQVSSHEVP